jgi:hypothetical protein
MGWRLRRERDFVAMAASCHSGYGMNLKSDSAVFSVSVLVIPLCGATHTLRQYSHAYEAE